VRVACCNPTLLGIAAVAANRPACARLVAVAPAGRSAASYTTTRDTTEIEVFQMFKLAQRRLFWWPVNVVMPDPAQAGKTITETFEMQFEALSLDQANELQNEIEQIGDRAELRARQFDFLKRVCVGWRDIVDGDGKTVPFSPEALHAAIQFSWYRDAVMRAYQKAIGTDEARAGN
ncbi:MAG TPA: hypothetical protein VIJ42_07660, partial [Stellaceae bacterium]